jgi:hypothetical protein
MAYHNNPRIVTDGLIFLLDAANPRCFGSGETSATDLVGGKSCTGANGTPGTGTHTPDTNRMPTYNSSNGGIFYFDASDGINVQEDLGSHSELSYSLWFKALDGAANRYFFDARNDGGTWFIRNYGGSNTNITWTDNLRYNFDATFNGSTSVFLNTWMYMVATSSSSGTLLYLNGTEITQSTEFRNVYVSNSSIDEDLGTNLRIGCRYTTSSFWYGYMGPIGIYDRVLSASEVSQNYNSMKTRFGL